MKQRLAIFGLLALTLLLLPLSQVTALPWCEEDCSCSTPCEMKCYSSGSGTSGPNWCISFICTDFCRGPSAPTDDLVQFLDTLAVDGLEEEPSEAEPQRAGDRVTD